MIPELAPELLIKIITLASTSLSTQHERTRTSPSQSDFLLSCSLVSKMFYHVAQRELFRHPHLWSARSAELFLERLDSREREGTDRKVESIWLGVREVGDDKAYKKVVERCREVSSIVRHGFAEDKVMMEKPNLEYLGNLRK